MRHKCSIFAESRAADPDILCNFPGPTTTSSSLLAWWEELATWCEAGKVTLNVPLTELLTKWVIWNLVGKSILLAPLSIWCIDVVFSLFFRLGAIGWRWGWRRRWWRRWWRRWSCRGAVTSWSQLLAGYIYATLYSFLSSKYLWWRLLVVSFWPKYHF